MDVPQDLIDSLHAAGDALAGTATTDETAANSEKAVVAAQEAANKDRQAALEAHQAANELAAKSIADVKRWLQLPATTPESQAPQSAPAQAQRVAGQTGRGAGTK